MCASSPNTNNDRLGARAREGGGRGRRRDASRTRRGKDRCFAGRDAVREVRETVRPRSLGTRSARIDPVDRFTSWGGCRRQLRADPRSRGGRGDVDSRPAAAAERGRFWWRGLGARYGRQRDILVREGAQGGRRGSGGGAQGVVCSARRSPPLALRLRLRASHRLCGCRTGRLSHPVLRDGDEGRRAMLIEGVASVHLGGSER